MHNVVEPAGGGMTHVDLEMHLSVLQELDLDNNGIDFFEFVTGYQEIRRRHESMEAAEKRASSVNTEARKEVENLRAILKQKYQCAS